jgi:uncharacterized protein
MGDDFKHESLPPVAEVKHSSTPFRVLTLDGGGIRGIYTASVLHGIAAHFLAKQEEGWDVGRHFNLIAGTSTGGLLACGLAAGLSTATIVRILEEFGPRIFSNPQPDGRLKLLLWATKCAGKPANSCDPLRAALQKGFENKTIGEIYESRKIALCIPASRLLDWSPKVFKTPHFKHFTRDKDVSLVDVCLATCAAPILMPVAVVNEANHADAAGKFVDGGLWANNPALIGLLEALDLCTDPETGKILRPIDVLSVGTSGGAAGEVLEDRVNRGLFDWGFGAGVIDLSLELQDRASDYVMAKLVNHFRNHGVMIRYQKIPNPLISNEQALQIKVDRADAVSVRLLKQLGDKQARFVQSECTKKTPLGELVTAIFSKPADISAKHAEAGD